LKLRVKGNAICILGHHPDSGFSCLASAWRFTVCV
jgi:hypothetical protein